MAAETILLGGLAALAANLPFMNERIFGLRTRQRKHFGWRLLEWMALYLLLGVFAHVLESRQSPPHPQNWPFYVTTLCLFLVLAWPGFIWRYFWRKPGI
ncbi:DUF2818 family protein [Chitinilyticum litopenaei]|uniref:DUF2818 family protein n=1 Tax=Chitinilyticum litopenaei TaxID=1121276 RepID=UPI000404705F|nr:DUF2818 family protein [Chitinilyticum litopenaei]